MAVPSAVGARVKDFYEAQPFNVSTPAAAAARVRQADQTRTYEDLSRYLDKHPRTSVCDLGCGGGWFVHSIAVHRRRPVTGIDFCRRALAHAHQTAQVLGIHDLVWLVQADIFALPLSPRSAFDVVNALGVLHHTYDTGAALRAAGAIVAPGGILHVGLYHRHGRAPFLSLFDPWREGPVGDVPPEHHAAAFARYRSLNHHVDDELLLRSWFVDQVLHPVERSHTLAEINALLTADGFVLRSSSLSRFRTLAADDDLEALDRAQYALSIRHNIDEGRYFPGFFTALYERSAS